MNIIKVTTINTDGSIKFEGFFGPEEARFILELGTNLLLQEGAVPFMEPDDEDDGQFFVEGSKTTQ